MSREDSTCFFFSADVEAHGHTSGCSCCAALASHGRATKPHNDECRERITTVVDRTLKGKARMSACRDRIAETGRVKERNRARVLRKCRDVPMGPRSEGGEQVAIRHADASGGDITENQNEENIMRDFHIGKRGSETANEEQLDKLRKTVRFEQEAPSTSLSSDPQVSLGYLASGERDKIGHGPFLCRVQVMSMTTYKFLRWMRSTRWTDERVVTWEKCWIFIEEKMSDISE